MRASGGLNPNAILVISRILVLVDSIRPLDRLCSIAARILALCLTMPFWSPRTRTVPVESVWVGTGVVFVFNSTTEGRGKGHRSCPSDAAALDARVAALKNYPYPQRLEMLLHRISNLTGKLLLNLETPGKDINQARHLGQAENGSIRNVGNMSDAEEWRKMVLA